MSIYKIIFAFIIFCFFQTTPSISFEIKLKIPKDLKKLGDKVKKELEKKEPEVKKKEVKKKEVKKEEVKKEEVKKEEVKLDPQGKDVIIIWKWVDGAGTYYESNPTFEIVKQERTIESNLPNCPEPKPVKSMMIRHVYWDNCYGIKLMDQGNDSIFGNDPIHKYEGEFDENGANGKGIFTTDTGGIAEGVWKNGKLVSSETMPEIVKGYSDRFKNCSAVDSFLTKEPDEKSNDLSGYKHIHFGMLKVDFYKILDCKSSLKIFDWDEYYGMGNNRDSSGKQGITIEGLYKYKVGIIFKDDVIDAVRLIMFTTPKIKRQFYQIGETGIEKFEQFKKALSSKYKLQTKPTKISKDEYNNKSTLSILTWVFKNNGNDNLILLKLFQIPAGDQVRYSYSGEIHYLSEEQSKSYTKEIDGTKVKSDDL